MLTAPVTSQQSAAAPGTAPAAAAATGGAAVGTDRTNAATPRAFTSRLAWLDALRGIAALIVALHHASYVYVPDWRAAKIDWIEPGKYGVLVFFLVSGYVIPASLERRGSLRGFWIGRFFRIYPLLALACLAGIVPFLLGIRGLRAGLEDMNPAVAILAHVTMLQDLLAVPSSLNVLWTLSYEMVFYLLVVALFVTGTHRLSALTATLLAVAIATVSALLPMLGLSRAFGTGPVVIGTVVLLTVAIAATVSGKRVLSTFGGVLGGLVALVLVTMNGRASAWEGLTNLAMMFAGTALFRAEHAWQTVRAERARRAEAATAAAAEDDRATEQAEPTEAIAPVEAVKAVGTVGTLGTVKATDAPDTADTSEATRVTERRAVRRVVFGLGAAVAVVVAAVSVGIWNAHTYLSPAEAVRFTIFWSVSVTLAAVTFAIAWLLRRRTIPRWLSRLGQISFSVYLLHPVLLIYSDQFFGKSEPDNPLWLLIFVVVLIAVSLLTYRWIEEPGQRLGRRITRRLTRNETPHPSP